MAAEAPCSMAAATTPSCSSRAIAFTIVEAVADLTCGWKAQHAGCTPTLIARTAQIDSLSAKPTVAAAAAAAAGCCCNLFLLPNRPNLTNFWVPSTALHGT